MLQLSFQLVLNINILTKCCISNLYKLLGLLHGILYKSNEAWEFPKINTEKYWFAFIVMFKHGYKSSCIICKHVQQSR